MERVRVHDSALGIEASGAHIVDTLVHAMHTRDGVSPSSVVSPGGGGLTVQHSTVLMNIEGNCALCLFSDTGAQSGNHLDGNLLAGGGYVLYGADGEQTSITGNRIGQGFYSTGGAFGVLAHFSGEGPGNVLAGNVFDTSGEPAN